MHRMLLLIFILSTCLSAQGLRIITWNAREVFNVDSVRIRAKHFKNFAESLEPDILCLQEVTSIHVVRAMRDVMGLKDYYVACSDFHQNDSGRYYALEVGIISRFPLSSLLEYDPIPDNIMKVDPPERKLEPSWELGIPAVQTYRGFLWAKIEEIKLTLVVTHLKSSRGYVGYEDENNARQREFVMACIAKSVLEDSFYFTDYNFIVCGDFNVGHSDSLKNGVDLIVDGYRPEDGKDLYDETHALLEDGLVNDLRMRNATRSILDSTYPSFPGSPIDNIYVGGILADYFSDAQTTQEETFGSDHKPVWIVWERP